MTPEQRSDSKRQELVVQTIIELQEARDKAEHNRDVWMAKGSHTMDETLAREHYKEAGKWARSHLVYVDALKALYEVANEEG